MLEVGTTVKMSGVVDAKIVRLVLKATKKRPAMYQIEYSLPGETRRYQQPRFTNEFTVEK